MATLLSNQRGQMLSRIMNLTMVNIHPLISFSFGIQNFCLNRHSNDHKCYNTIQGLIHFEHKETISVMKNSRFGGFRKSKYEGAISCLHLHRATNFIIVFLQKLLGFTTTSSSSSSSSLSRATKGAFLVTDYRFFRSLATFVRFAPLTPLTHSLIPQRFVSLPKLCSLTPFRGSLTHFPHSLVRQLKFKNMCSC